MCSRQPLCVPDTMKLLEDSKTKGSEDELNNAMRMLARLMASRIEPGYDDPHIAPMKRQLLLFHNDFAEIDKVLKLARTGRHAFEDAKRRTRMKREVLNFEELTLEADGGKRQLQELSCLAYLTEKQVIKLSKQAPSERQILKRIMGSSKALSQMENRLDIAQKQFNVMNAKNSVLRSHINRLLVERTYFNTVWYKLIQVLVKGKLYLLDIFATANRAFEDRKDMISRVKALKWKANFELDIDVMYMQELKQKLDYLQQFEEFLRIKGTLRICEATEIERKKQEEATRLEQRQIVKLEVLLKTIQVYCNNKAATEIMSDFELLEVRMQSIFTLICYIFAEYTAWYSRLGPIKNDIIAQELLNVTKEKEQSECIDSLTQTLSGQVERVEQLSARDSAINFTVMKGLEAVEELARMVKIDYNPIVNMLGNAKSVHRFNTTLYLLQIQRTVMQLLHVYIYMKAKADQKKVEKKGTVRIDIDPKPARDSILHSFTEILRPNHIDKLVTYQPCAYCVEEFIMNQVRDHPWEVFTDEDVMNHLLSEEPNTPFSIYTITDPSKRHPLANVGGS